MQIDPLARPYDTLLRSTVGNSQHFRHHLRFSKPMYSISRDCLINIVIEFSEERWGKGRALL